MDQTKTAGSKPDQGPTHADAVARVWSSFRNAWHDVHGAWPGKKPPKRGGLKTVVREHGESGALLLIRWWQHSTDQRAAFLRENRIGHRTLFGPEKAREYLDEWARPWDAGVSSPAESKPARTNGGDFMAAMRAVAAKRRPAPTPPHPDDDRRVLSFPHPVPASTPDDDIPF